MHLYADTDVPDTDFVCRLTDVSPEGCQRQITTGFVRARHRNGLRGGCLKFSAAGEVEFHRSGQRRRPIPGGMPVIAALHKVAHVEPPALGSDYAVAHDRIFFGGEKASCLELSVL